MNSIAEPGRSRLLAAVLAVTLLFAAGASAQNEFRKWRLKDGTTFEGRLVSTDGLRALIDVKGGGGKNLAVQDLGILDRIFLQSHAEVSGAAVLPPAERWPEKTSVQGEFSIRGEGRLFRTEHFQFETDREVSADFVSSVAAVFEGTHRAIGALPLDLRPIPPEGMERFLTRFTDRRSFLVRVDPGIETLPGQKLQGIYSARERSVLVPYDSIQTTNRRAGNEGDFNSNTLIHEITHQLTHEWLPFMPYWLSEGIAEYIGMVPYDRGQFDFTRAEEGLKEILKSRFRVSGTVELIHPADLFPAEAGNGWRGSMDEYLSSLMMTVFFIHHDGNNTGETLTAFFREMRKARDGAVQFLADYNNSVKIYEKQRLAYEKEVREYNAALAEKRKGTKGNSATSSTVGVGNAEKTGGRVVLKGKSGTAVVPVKPVLPEILQQNPNPGIVDVVGISNERALPLLMKGRDFDQLAATIEKAFSEAGIPVKIREQGWTPKPE